MTTDEKLDLILSEITGIKAGMGGMETEIGGVKSEIGGIKAEMAGMKSEIGGIKTEIGGMKAEMSEMKKDIKSVDKRLSTLEFVVENEIRYNIRVIAEGHLDLRRFMIKVLDVAREDEMYHVRVNELSSRVRQLQEEFEEFKAARAS